ncbi:MAG TPA: hypothetical protein VHO28_01360 [Ignavibacteriales bacterium]|nr:hypothetical protein [Ignavibacteriales bacterium]
MKNTYKKCYSIIFFISALYLTGCADDIKDFTAPKFDQNIYAPIVVKKYTLEDIVEDDTANIKTYNDPDRLGQLYYGHSQSFDPIIVNDQLTLDGAENRENRSLTQLNLDNLDPVNAILELNAWTPLTPGQNAVFPPIGSSFTLNFPEITRFSEAVFASPSELTLVFENRLPVSTTINSIALRNASDNTIIASSSYTLNLPPNGGKDSISMPLTGALMRNQIRVTGNMSTPGSGGSSVAISSDAGTYVTAKFQNISLRQATAVFPAQDPLVFVKDMIADDSTHFTDVSLMSGWLIISLDNYIDLPFDATVRINELITPSGQPFTQVYPFNGIGSNVPDSINITGWRLHSAVETNLINYTITFASKATANERTVKTTDTVVAKLTLSGLVVDAFAGRVKPTRLDRRQTGVKLEVENLEENFTYDQIDFSDPSLILNLNFSANLEIGLSGVLVAKNATTTRTAPIPYQVLQAQVRNQIAIDKTDLRNLLNAFMHEFPDSMYVLADAVTNPNYLLGSINSQDSIFGNVELELPLKLSLTGGKFTDSVDVDIENDSKDDIDNIKSINLIFEVESELPVEMIYKGYLIDGTGQRTLNLPPGLDSIMINPATVDGSGNVVTTGKTYREIILSNDDIVKFINSSQAVSSFEMNTAGPNNNPVEFHLDDAIDVRIRAIITYHADPDEEN